MSSSAIFLAFWLVFAFLVNDAAAADCLANYGAAPLRVACCDYQRNYTRGSLTEKNLQTVLGELLNSSLQPAAYKTSYAPAAAVGGGGSENSSATTAIYGLLQCYAGTSSSQCNQCARDAVNSTPASCPNATAATAWFDDCFLRFENSNFTAVLDNRYSWYVSNVYEGPDDAAVFDKAAHQLLNNLITKALQRSSPNYAFGSNVSEHSTIYGFVQCWRDISVDDCRSCLYYGLRVLRDNVKGRYGARLLEFSCFLRYESYPFFTAEKHMHHSKLAVIISATIGSLLGVLLLFGCGFLAYRGRRITRETGARPKETHGNLVDQDGMVMFNFKTLKAATNNFDANLKVGEGGFGEVYKATLPNGRVVAAKRLLVRSAGGKQEFENEINLLARVQHRNLIKLLGCCTEGSHMILVYEFLPNGSLDKILFDPQKAKFLEWEKRYNIIIGTAKGLVYLHEGSKIRIIHRDIKANNILLDEKFDVKVADFGVAKLFEEDQSHVQTRVAGTYGYMAPEHVMQGQLSNKSDVYSFGVLVAEIVTGKRNSEFDTEMGVSSLLGWAWSLYQEGKISMMVDEVVKATGNMEDVIRCIHVALLCAQVDPSLRPPMSSVQLMLSSASVTLPFPTRPAFVTQEYSTSTNLSPINQHVSNATVSISDIEPK